MKKTTLADVAAYAGVTPATASYYFRGTKKLSPEVEQKLDEGASVLHYVPIHSRKTPKISPRTKFVNMCVILEKKDTRDDMYIFCLMNGVIGCLAEQGYQLVINHIVDDDPKSRDFFIAGLEHSAGVIICNNRKKHRLEDELTERKIPYVLLGSPEKAETNFYVDIDIQGVGFQAAEYFLAKGHRRILFLNLAESMLQSQLRREGFILAHKQRGLNFIEENHVFAPISADACYGITKEYFASKKAYTAVVTSNEIQAQGVIRALKELKISVPSKVSILTMGGTMLGALSVPSLTTIDFDPKKHGSETAKLLLDVLTKKRIQSFHLILPGILVERDSTK